MKTIFKFKGRTKEWQREYRDKNKTEINNRIRQTRIDVLKILGLHCENCGYDLDVRALQIDHVNGGGNQEVKLFSSNIEMYRYYLKHPKEAKEKLQTLCANCNTLKRYTHKEGCYG